MNTGRRHECCSLPLMTLFANHMKMMCRLFQPRRGHHGKEGEEGQKGQEEKEVVFR
jgi:hypothetical protein